MPQLDPTFFTSQLFWLFISVGILYYYLSSHGVDEITSMIRLRQEKLKHKTDYCRNLEMETKELTSMLDEKIDEARKAAHILLAKSKKDTDIMAIRKRDEFSTLIKKRISATEERLRNHLNEATPEINSNAKDLSLTVLKTLHIEKIDTKKIDSDLEKIA